MNVPVSMDRLVSRRGTENNERSNTGNQSASLLPWVHEAETSRTVISGDNLARLLVPWAHKLIANRDGDAEALDLTFKQRGQEVEAFLAKETRTFDDGIADRMDDELLLAFTIFLISLSKCAEAIWGDDMNFRSYDDTWFMSRRVHEILDRHIWQWSEVLGGGIPFAAYATSRLMMTQDNEITVGLEPRDANHDPDKIPHVTPGCECALVKPSMEAVRKLLLADDVPAVVFDGTGLTVRPASKGPYVAISHVWADGLGSSTQRGLPRCQVERLDAVVRTLHPDGAFWHDGLCVPSPKTDRSVWQRAIKLLRDTYFGADKVLVIDRGIREQSSLATPKEECLLRIATSTWMGRVWTLQEGMLAPELYFEVSDGVISCSHFDNEVSHLACRLIPTLRFRLRGAKFEPRIAEWPRCSINDLIELMSLRSISYPEDEPLAIGGLLNVDTEKLAITTDGEERMKELLLQVREIPHTLLLYGWGVEQRLSIPNFTWAPMSLTEIRWPAEPGQFAVCTEQGLSGTFTVARFPDVSVRGLSGVVTNATDPSQEANASGRENDPGRCALANAANRIGFQLWPSPVVDLHLTFNGFLTNCAIRDLKPKRDHGVALVHVMSDSLHEEDTKLRCKYVGPASVSWIELGEETDMSSSTVEGTVQWRAVNVE